MKRYLLLLCIALNLHAQESPRVEFVILVTSYNTKKYVRRNLDSLINQRSTFPYEIIVVDDGSTDGTGKEMDDYAQEHALPFLKIIHNPVRKGSALENIYTTVHERIPDHKIVVCCDGDDTFSCNRVLERLEKEYVNPDVWMTYGRFVVYPAGEFWSLCWATPEEVIRSRTFRQCSNVPSHLKTFRAGLFKKIKKEDLLDPTGTFYKKAWDMAMLFPMLEMCAPKDEQGINHSVFIADMVLYVYNFENPIGDFQTGRAEQIALDCHIRSQPPYEPVDHL